MWVVQASNQAPLVIATPADADVSGYLRRDHPGAAIYRCDVPNAANIAKAHENATAIVLVDTDEDDGDGQPMKARVHQPIGNTLAIGSVPGEPEGSVSLLLLTPDGTLVTSLPLTKV